ncbi:hypothetical protein TNCV_3894761 [Trichonephila clavipes]|nr:hypothetical protein TNCV_3894761 [Trichonephila clavipes]
MSPKRLITSRLTGVDSLLPPVYSEAWAKESAKISRNEKITRAPRDCDTCILLNKVSPRGGKRAREAYDGQKSSPQSKGSQLMF